MHPQFKEIKRNKCQFTVRYTNLYLIRDSQKTITLSPASFQFRSEQRWLLGRTHTGGQQQGGGSSRTTTGFLNLSGGLHAARGQPRATPVAMAAATGAVPRGCVGLRTGLVGAEAHLGVADRVLAEFVVDLGRAFTFDATFRDQGAELLDSALRLSPPCAGHLPPCAGEEERVAWCDAPSLMSSAARIWM